MVNLFKKIMFVGTLLIIFSLIGCSSTRSGNQMPDSKPKDFNFVFDYGVNAKNQLDTINGQYTKDMVMDSSITTNLVLSDEEMNSIYLELKKINILKYSDNYKPKSNVRQTPFQTYSIKIILNGKEKNVHWKDENVSKSKEAVNLRETFNKIEEIIINKEEYKKLPPAKGGYD